jgi:predicted adenylyl cyclase CyaB
MNKEIEIRTQLYPEQEKTLREYLHANYEATQTLHQTDYYLDNPQSPFFTTFPEGDKDASIFLRLRQTQNSTMLGVKHSHNVPGSRKPLYCNEYETKIEKLDETLKLFKLIGFTDVTVVNKTRTTFNVDNILEIAVDEVEKCGTFMEIEVKKDVETIEEGYQLIYDWLRSIGIKKFKRQMKGYIHIIMNPAWEFGEKEITL